MFKHHVFIFNVISICTSINAGLFVSETKINRSMCGSVVFDDRPKVYTFILDTLKDNWILNNCLSLLTEKDDKIIFNGEYVPNMITRHKLVYFTNNTPGPNVIIFTRSLSNIFFTSRVAGILFQSHWSPVNIVVVDNSTYSCKNGYFNKEVKSSIYNFLNNLWNTYQTVYVVIEYPNDCPNKFTTYDGNKKPNQKVGELYKRTITTVRGKNLQETLKKSDKYLTHGYPLKANIFYRFPTSITACTKLSLSYNSNLTKGYCGVDALVMHDVLRTFKFNTTFEMEDTTNYGYAQSGQVTGTLGLIVRGEIDISFNSRFMVLYLIENRFNFLFLMWSDSLCAIMYEPSEIPLWHYPYDIYDIAMWASILSCLALLGSVMYVKSKTFGKYRLRTLQFYVYVVNAVWSGLFGFFFNKKIERSLLAGTCLVCSVVFTATYQGHVNYMFTTSVRYHRYKTLSELRNNNVEVYTSPAISYLLGHRYSEGYIASNYPNNAKTALVQNLKFYPENSSATVYILEHHNVATIERSDVLLNGYSRGFVNLTDENGRPILYAVNECFQQYYLSFIVRTGFLFTSDLQVLMMKIVEAGLPDFYYKWTRYTMKVVDAVAKPNSEPRPFIKISLSEQRIPLILLLTGYVVSIAVFAVEMWWDTRARHAINVAVQEYID